MNYPEGRTIDSPLPAEQVADQICSESPFSLEWLRALDPRTFTPITLQHGRETTIRLRTPDGSLKVNVARIISLFVDGMMEIKDEAYAFSDTEAGNQEVSMQRFTFDRERRLTDFDHALTPSPRMKSIVDKISSFVGIAGSTIQADNYYYRGRESSFRSDGTQWVEANSGLSVPVTPPITPGQPMILPPTNE